MIMDDVLQRFEAIRHEIDSLKTALQGATDDAERHELHARINDCIRESLQLIDQRLIRQNTTADTAPAAARADQAAGQQSPADDRL